MEWKLTREPLASLEMDAIIVFHANEGKSVQGVAREVDEALGFRISNLIAAGEISGDFTEVTDMHNWGKIPAGRVFVVGLGDEGKLELHSFKNAVATAARAAKHKKVKSLGIDCPSFMIERYNSVDVIQSIVEGIELGSYQHHSYKSEDKSESLEEIRVFGDQVKDSAFAAGVERGRIFARATNFARYLVHEPANFMTPEALADHARAIAEKRGIELDILTEDRLRELGMNALLSVAEGSANRPRMIVLSYKGAPESDDVIGLVGKGVTFDSGGLQLKPGKGMGEMKDDMGGAAAVLAAMDAIGELRPHSNVIAVIPACENMTGSRAFRPGDVIRSFSGKTIEVHHTDAEGRLILADAIAYAKHLGATRLVDIATLTGGVVVALGHVASGLMSNDAQWAEEVKKAARIAGERVWELPMYEEYEQYVDSEIADVKNDAGSTASCIQGGLFLRRFAEPVPWVHLDIAGTVTAPEEKGIFVKGATGTGVRTLIQLAICQG
ncbi:leucyl aminopeptidase [Thermoactinomyces sp. CICC 10523]|uniref:leucyl aminopeptidase n=1 Tax=Thermoactinomyces sp. CICC 10523 TaxID=2767428 RepID=UPI0018DC81F2|nr:leucyl aminopeptidase [Thermoactinomyces sp. CICC 10523]MBH8598022.1 leucyl aminopeptidase [Thermoactinomyces sp. CICC 10523]